MHDILALDVAGTPVRWIDTETAAGYYAINKVRWELGAERILLRGGVNRALGRRSTLEIAAIIFLFGAQVIAEFERCSAEGASEFET